MKTPDGFDRMSVDQSCTMPYMHDAKERETKADLGSCIPW